MNLFTAIEKQSAIHRLVGGITNWSVVSACCLFTLIKPAENGGHVWVECPASLYNMLLYNIDITAHTVSKQTEHATVQIITKSAFIWVYFQCLNTSCPKRLLADFDWAGSVVFSNRPPAFVGSQLLCFPITHLLPRLLDNHSQITHSFLNITCRSLKSSLQVFTI